MVMSVMSAYADHDKECKAKHGTVSAKTDNSITVDGKTYNLDANTTVSTHSGTTANLASVKVGDKVCVETGTGESKQVSKVVVMDKNAKIASSDGSRVRAKMSDLDRKTHEKICKGHHGTISDKTANTLTIDGKEYAFKINTPVNKQEEPLLPKTVKVGDRVCFDLKEAADGTRQIAKMIAIDDEADKARVREKESDSDTKLKVKSSPNKVEVETPDKKVEVK